MKLVKENLYQDFLQFKDKDSDPIKDMGIGTTHVIEKWLHEHNITKYVLSKEGNSINVHTTVDINNVNLRKFPDFIRFNHIIGGFHCEHTNLVSLEGCPYSVTGSFLVRYNKLKDLKDTPQIVRGVYSVSYNQITTIKHLTDVAIFGSLYLSHNKLKDLEGVSDFIEGDFYIHDNPLETLEFFPRQVEGNLTYTPSKIVTREKIERKCKVKGNIIEKL